MSIFTKNRTAIEMNTIAFWLSICLLFSSLIIIVFYKSYILGMPYLCVSLLGLGITWEPPENENDKN